MGEKKDEEKKNDEEKKEDGEKKDEEKKKEEEEPPIMKKREKKKNHVIQLKVERVDAFPLPMSPEQLSEAMDTLHAMTKHDNEAAELEEVKNDLESFFYNAREKL